MAVIGFLFLILLGGGLVWISVLQALASKEFTGRFGIAWTPYMAIGLILIGMAIKYSPFLVHLKP